MEMLQCFLLQRKSIKNIGGRLALLTSIKYCDHSSAFSFNWILFILAVGLWLRLGNENNHKILNEFEFPPDQTSDPRVSCP